MSVSTPAPPNSSPSGIRSVGIRRPQSGRARTEALFLRFCMAAAALSIVILIALLSAILFQGTDFLRLDFVQSAPSRKPDEAGMGPAIWGSIWVCVTCAFFALPIGVGTAILLEEFKPKHPFLQKLHGFIQLNISNLAGVPSIVYGIIGMTAFVEMFGSFGNALEPAMTLGTRVDWYYIQLPFGRGVLAGALTLMLVILPIVIISSQEALRAVPDSLRHAALGLGSTRWQSVSKVSLPAAIPGI